MYTSASALCRGLACGSAAVAITLSLGAAFVQSTAAAPGTRGETVRALALEATPVWFGQPQPAVLVD